MIDLTNSQIKINAGAIGNEEIYQNVQVIISTPVGTVAFDRDFGVDYSILDNPTEIAKGLISVEIIEKIRKYESRVDVDEVTFSVQNEKIIPKIILSLV